MGKHQIQVRALYKKGIHYEEIKDFQQSIFSDVYRMAAKGVQRIVKDNGKYKDESWPRKRDRNEQIEIANAISFIGERGVGKTSSLLSFAKGLEQHGSAKYGSIYGWNKDMEDIQFFSISCIDAAILEDAESVFVLVLANMLKRIDKKNEFSRNEENYEKQNIIKSLEELYSQFKSLKENDVKEQEWMYSAYERLKNLSSSQRIREHFASLVKQYLKYLSNQERENRKEAYLVISIDDIDMSYYNLSSYDSKKRINSKSYEIMNSIQKYLSVPGVIVLVSYNDENLHKQCQSFFAGSNYMNPLNDREKELAFKESAHIANQFMEKVFSPINRVYMSSWKKIDLEDGRLEVVLEERFCKNNLFSGYLENGKNILSLKEFILTLYAAITGIYYDPLGQKQHFLEPQSLRELNDMFHLLVENENILEQKVEQNRYVIVRVQNDVYFRFIQEKLVVLEELQKMQFLLELPLDRRVRVIANEIKDKVAPLGKSIKNEIAKLEAEKQRILKSNNINYKDIQKIEDTLSDLKHIGHEHYGFSDLVHSVYHMTRETKDAGELLYSKEFAACILHSLSIQLSKCYMEYRDHKIQGELEKIVEDSNYKILKKVIGNSIFGHWAEYLIPEVFWSMVPGQESKRTTIAYIDNVSFRYFFYILGETMEYEKYIKEIVFMLSMNTNLLNWEEIEVDFILGQDKVGVSILSLVRSEFDLTAFMKYGFMYEEYLEKVESLLICALKNAETQNEKVEKIKEKLINAAENYFITIKKDYYEWDMKYENMMIPIHNFDLTYNMIKHLYEEGKKKNSMAFNIGEGGKFLNAYNNMLSDIEHYLARIDEYYYITEIKDSFASCFKENPFIKQLREFVKEAKSQNFEGSYVEQNIYSMVINVVDNETTNISGADDTAD